MIVINKSSHKWIEDLIKALNVVVDIVKKYLMTNETRNNEELLFTRGEPKPTMNIYNCQIEGAHSIKYLKFSLQWRSNEGFLEIL